jgi:hypothetical protein
LNKPPLAILNGTSYPIGLHNEHSLFQRISIHLHYDVKASEHLAFLLTTDWQRERQALDYLYLILSFRVANFPFANSQNTQPHFITGMTCKCIVLLFILQTNIFRGYPRMGRTVRCLKNCTKFYSSTKKLIRSASLNTELELRLL